MSQETRLYAIEARMGVGYDWRLVKRDIWGADLEGQMKRILTFWREARSYEYGMGELNEGSVYRRSGG